MTAQRPPLGIMPEKEWIRHRLADLIAASCRYIEAGLVPKSKWLEEACRHAETLGGQARPAAPQDSSKDQADSVKPKVSKDEKSQGPVYYIGEF